MRYNKDIRRVMEQWAQWRRTKVGAHLGYPSATTLGRMMDGMPGTICPACRGRDEHCEVCFGSGRVKLDVGDKTNPAFIRSTRREPDDAQSEAVDRLMCELRRSAKMRKYFFVLWAEYVQSLGTQEMKAARMNVSHSYYRLLLHQAHALIEIGLQAPKDARRLSREPPIKSPA